MAPATLWRKESRAVRQGAGTSGKAVLPISLTGALCTPILNWTPSTWGLGFQRGLGCCC